MNFNADENGYYGEYGGAFIPEMLFNNIEALNAYKEIIFAADFQQEFQSLLSTFAGRPTPLYFAENFSKKVGSPVFFKREDLLHTGAHKINNAIGQALLAKRLGKTRIIAETGAGQHGVATSAVCARLGLECVIYMGEEDIKRQSPNVLRMKMMGATIIPAVSGSKTLKDATNEAMRDWIQTAASTHYIIGSVVGPHPFPELVATFNSVTSKEIKEQFPKTGYGEKPQMIVACVGGGSNAIGAFYHFLNDLDVSLVGIEAAGHGIESDKTAATITLGTAGVLHGSRTLVLQDKAGQVQEAHSISAGLDYPGVGPQHAFLADSKRVSYHAITDDQALAAAALVSRTEGIIPALETSHALAWLLEAKPQMKSIVLNLSGRGDKDLFTYERAFKR